MTLTHHSSSPSQGAASRKSVCSLLRLLQLSSSHSSCRSDWRCSAGCARSRRTQQASGRPSLTIADAAATALLRAADAAANRRTLQTLRTARQCRQSLHRRVSCAPPSTGSAVSSSANIKQSFGTAIHLFQGKSHRFAVPHALRIGDAQIRNTVMRKHSRELQANKRRERTEARRRPGARRICC